MTYYPDGTLIARPPAFRWMRRRTATYESQITSANSGLGRGGLTFGWLTPDHPVSKGPVPEELIQVLERAALTPVDRTRGYHHCEFCHIQRGPQQGTEYLTALGEELQLGSACIEIVDSSGRVWKAPNLVLHYIQAHGYLPPMAVRTLP